MTNAENVAPKPDRLASLDQFRGYTVVGMFLVNFVGSYAAIATFLPNLKHWNTHCSYADTIMPQFLFAVGFSFRMSYLKRLEKDGATLANWRVVRRILGLLLVAFIVHHLDGNYATYESLAKVSFWELIQTSFQRNYFQTLAHIGVTSLWVVPVIGRDPLVRVLFAIGSCVLFVLLSTSWYYEWEMERPGIDGGPLGFLTWTAPLILGTLAFDIWKSQLKKKVLTIFTIGLVAMLFAYGLSCISMFAFPNNLPEQKLFHGYLAEPPFSRPVVPGTELLEPSSDKQTEPRSLSEAISARGESIPKPSGHPIDHWANRRKKVFEELRAKGELPADAKPNQVELEKWIEPDTRYLNQWTMSQRSGSPAYTLFGGGLGMVIFALMMIVCDGWGVQIGMFRTLGVNALIGYILHGMVFEAVKPFAPKDSPLWFIFLAFGIALGICYLVLRTLEKQKILFRL